ncbi:ACP S-malonyltransferase [Caldilinea sp.]|uniref:ACP S-malonyltransferase n=1 Tax=Caldilinea sp. TaxID=2293560 RepID=UPI002C96FC81|nr:ACP S-malonyltransferase [Caldilinea sp.]
MEPFSYLKRVNHTAFLFPGQGSQHVGMAGELVEHYPTARAALEEADAVLGFALSRLMLDGPETELTDTINAQPALMAASMAAMRALEAEMGEAASGAGAGVFVAGHSMGEYTALVAAGSISYADGLRLVRERGRLMKLAGDRAPGRMAAVLGLEEAQVAEVCARVSSDGFIVQVANDNCPGQLVISGDAAGMAAAMAALTAAGARKVAPLAVSIAAHSPLMQPAAAALRTAIAQTAILPPQAPVVGNTTATLLTTVEAIRDELNSQLTDSVRWTASIQHLASAGVTTFVEIGAGEVLTGLVKRIARDANRVTVKDVKGVRAYVATLR